MMCRYALFVALCALWSFVAHAEQKIQTIELTDAQALQVSELMLVNGDLDATESLLNDILQSDDVNIRTGALFQLGRVATARGDYDTAQRYFLTILKFHPDLTNVRFELGYVYFLDGQYTLAEFHFRLVLGDTSLPDDVVEKVRALIIASRQRKDWYINAGLSVVPDSNINYVSGQTQQCIDFGFGPLCRPLDDETSGIGVRYNLGGEYYLRLSDRWGIKTSASLSALDFATSQYDDYSLYFATGPRYLSNWGEISMQPFVQLRWYAGDYYATTPGVRADITWDVTGRLYLSTGMAYNYTAYKHPQLDAMYSSNEYSAYIQPRYYINNKSFILAGVSAFYNNARVESYGYNGQSYSIGYFGELPWTLTLFARLDLINTLYNDDELFRMADNSLQSAKRHDITYQASIRLSSRYLEYERLYPSLSYTYTHRDSNVPIFDFDKHRVEIELNYRF